MSGQYPAARGMTTSPLFFVGVYMPGGAGCALAMLRPYCEVAEFLYFRRLFTNLARAIQTIVPSRSSAAQ
jgi:hypothetical protein